MIRVRRSSSPSTGVLHLRPLVRMSRPSQYVVLRTGKGTVDVQEGVPPPSRLSPAWRLDSQRHHHCRFRLHKPSPVSWAQRPVYATASYQRAVLRRLSWVAHRIRSLPVFHVLMTNPLGSLASAAAGHRRRCRRRYLSRRRQRHRRDSGLRGWGDWRSGRGWEMNRGSGRRGVASWGLWV